MVGKLQEHHKGMYHKLPFTDDFINTRGKPLTNKGNRKTWLKFDIYFVVPASNHSKMEGKFPNDFRNIISDSDSQPKQAGRALNMQSKTKQNRIAKHFIRGK